MEHGDIYTECRFGSEGLDYVERVYLIVNKIDGKEYKSIGIE